MSLAVDALVHLLAYSLYDRRYSDLYLHCELQNYACLFRALQKKLMTCASWCHQQKAPRSRGRV